MTQCFFCPYIFAKRDSNSQNCLWIFIKNMHDSFSTQHSKKTCLILPATQSTSLRGVTKVFDSGLFKVHKLFYEHKQQTECTATATIQFLSIHSLEIIWNFYNTFSHINLAFLLNWTEQFLNLNAQSTLAGDSYCSIIKSSHTEIEIKNYSPPQSFQLRKI